MGETIQENTNDRKTRKQIIQPQRTTKRPIKRSILGRKDLKIGGHGPSGIRTTGRREKVSGGMKKVTV